MGRTTARVMLITSTALLLTACSQPPANEANATASAETVSLLAMPAGCDTPTTPFCNSTVPLPSGWQGHVFQLAQNYPATAPGPETGPWLQFDPMTQPMEYSRAVLAYFYEGNIRSDIDNSFNPALNTIRQWYNAPWQDQGFNGREPIHGLTRERVSLPGELHRCQTSPWNNYAVGFYNAPGGFTIGRIWQNRGRPDPTLGLMPEGTVAAKLLFTTASDAEVPYLAGSPTWPGYVYAQVNARNPAPNRAVVPVRLLQIDIAVKDRRAPLGWVFGTFVYGGGPQGDPAAPCPQPSGGPSPAGANWANVQPVGLMWGNDPGHSGSAPLTETWLNPAVRMPHVGWQNRLNGPVDNPISSCMSCHATAQWPAAAAMIPSPTGNPFWFRNVPAGTAFGVAPGQTPPNPPPVSLDYSLQVQVGIANFNAARAASNPQTPAAERQRLIRGFNETQSPRDGAPTH